MRLLQYRETGGHRAVAALEDGQPPAQARRLQDVENAYELALEALEIGKPLLDVVHGHGTDAAVDLTKVTREGRLLAPLEHPVPTRCWITGHDGTHGWFFRGNGATLLGGAQALPVPDFAASVHARPAVVGLYVIADDGTPCRLGWALGNDLIDADAARAEGRLRASAVGPELLPGDLPAAVEGTLRVRRGAEVIHERPFAVGDLALGQKIAGIEANLFRYPMFRRPGDVHLHFLTAEGGAAGPALQAGDVCEIAAGAFALALVNPLAAVAWAPVAVRPL